MTRKRHPSGLIQCFCLLAGLSVIITSTARADDADLKKELQDARVQLAAAQDRKNELNSENVKLNSHIADLEKQLDQARHQQTTEAERTYALRARMAAFDAFMKQNPETLQRWRLWLNFDVHPVGTWQFIDTDWP